MRATFIGGPCGGHSHAVDDDNVPDTRPHGCEHSSKKDDVKGHYERVGSPTAIVSEGASTMRDAAEDDNAAVPN